MPTALCCRKWREALPYGRATAPIQEQTSARRFHHEVKLTMPSDVDAELVGWLKAGYELSG